MSGSHPDLVARVADELRQLAPGPAKALVAVSGGPDSVALLDLLCRGQSLHGLELVAAHFDHGIHPDSRQIAERVASLAATYGISCLMGQGDLGPGTTETTARSARRRWLLEAARQHAVKYLVTAHHADDQVETVLMRFLAGSGSIGLAGIQPRQGPWIRPLLAIDKHELAGYVEVRGLETWTDPANAEVRHLRSWLRVAVLPLLESRIPRLRENLTRAASVLREQRAAWDQLVNELPGLDLRREAGAVSVAAATVAGYSSAVRQALVLALGRQLGVVIGRAAAARVERLLEAGQSGRSADLNEGASAELSLGRLRLSRLAGHPWDGVTLTGPEGQVAVGGWQVSWATEAGPASLDRRSWVSWFPRGTPLSVRRWWPGDLIRPIRGNGTRLVVRCMQEERVERASRPLWPVIVAANEVVWVPGVCRGAAEIPEAGAPATRIEVRAR